MKTTCSRWSELRHLVWHRLVSHFLAFLAGACSQTYSQCFDGRLQHSIPIVYHGGSKHSKPKQPAISNKALEHRLEPRDVKGLIVIRHLISRKRSRDPATGFNQGPSSVNKFEFEKIACY